MSRLIFLKEVEKEIQSKWNNTAFASTARDQNKYFATFPFPYMNGRLHLGHVFTLLKADIMARFHRINGYNVLFPFGFHGTGIPISAAANKLKEEYHTQLGKQYETLKRMDIPENEIVKFTDPNYWIEYFPEMALKHDLPSLGCSIDYRRSFITTEVNPHFSSFVQWQFNKLKDLGYVTFGKKMVIYSEKDGQPCSDADRTVGEGVEIKEMKIALVNLGHYHGYVTYDETVPHGQIVKSKTFDQNAIVCENNVVMHRYFYRNYIGQNLGLINITDEKYIPLDFHECDISHGSGLYSSDQSLKWIAYREPESLIVSRSGDICIVAETDQWYIMYDDQKWKDSVYHYVDASDMIPDPIIKNLILETIKKSHPWPCSRTFGLGTKMPFDSKYLIDSLSDSTIYMAYYTVSHLINQIPSVLLCDAIWDAIFFGKEYVIPEYSDLITEMRKEFCYWYPMDLRVSGKDLITNHLTMTLFNHLAIFGEWAMPKRIYANGHILVNGEKMSKNKGNFITLKQAVDKYGADVTRLIAATAGDDTNDGNFNEKDTDPIILSLYAETQIILDSNRVKTRIGKFHLIDHMHLLMLVDIINKVKQAYQNMIFRDVVQYAFYELQSIRNKYLNPHWDILNLYCQVEIILMSPIIPHWSTYLSQKLDFDLQWPLIMIDGRYDNMKTKWLIKYLDMIATKFSKRLKKIKNPKTIQSCTLMINNDIRDYLDIIIPCDLSNKEQRKEVISRYAMRSQKNTMIELFTHIEKMADIFDKRELATWLCEDNSEYIGTYLSFYYPKINFEIRYQPDVNGDALNPVFNFTLTKN